jgi:hypothetical protein
MNVAALDLAFSEPDRPPSVPVSAEWDFESGTWVLGRRDAAGELQGELRVYAADGTPQLEQHYRRGKRHGSFRRFHRSGALAQAGRYFEGLLDGFSISYSDGDDSESIRECCIPAAARTLRQEHRRGVPLVEAFYAADGSVIVAEGGVAHELREREDDVLLSAYDFWPAREAFAVVEGDVVSVAQPLQALRDAIVRAGQRLAAYRAALRRKAPELVPPDVSALVKQPLPLRRQSVVLPGSEMLALIDEEPSVRDRTPQELALKARLEWTTLCWLCWAAGLDRIALPERLTPRPELYAALLHASSRVAALDGAELSLEAYGHFHGLDETCLPASALSHLADHYREIRAVLLFVSDAECVSPWQDDLGRAS